MANVAKIASADTLNFAAFKIASYENHLSTSFSPVVAIQ